MSSNGFGWIFSYPFQTKEFVLSTHFFSAVHVHLIHLKSNEWQAISAVKFEIRLGVKETLSVYKT